MSGAKKVVVSGAAADGAAPPQQPPRAIKNWLTLRTSTSAFFVADWHAHDRLGRELRHRQNTSRWCLRWLAIGLDPALHDLPAVGGDGAIAGLYLPLGMLTPCWLERNPTYKEQQRTSKRDLSVRVPRLLRCLQAGRPPLQGERRPGRHRPGAAHQAGARDRPALQHHVRRDSSTEPARPATES